MLVIRLQRIGKKHQPSYRITVCERRSKVGAPPTEQLGSCDPCTKKASINKERVAHWLKVGAKPSDTVWNLFVREKAVEGKIRPIRISKKKGEAAKEAVPAAKAGDKPAAV
ncbi:MAG: 30S ribosomal protein S16 [Candidatus Liptonbacteria bacterium]|nr:30S ribosomal protein S16 [Candidatus Liptonbacteria bacterium]